MDATERIRPPFMLYTLHAEGSRMDSYVHLAERDMTDPDGPNLRTHALTPAQARALASQLTRAADVAERRA